MSIRPFRDIKRRKTKVINVGNVKIGGDWKDISNIYTKVSNAWKEVTAAYVNIGGAWKPLFNSGINFVETSCF